MPDRSRQSDLRCCSFCGARCGSAHVRVFLNYPQGDWRHIYYLCFEHAAEVVEWLGTFDEQMAYMVREPDGGSYWVTNP